MISCCIYIYKYKNSDKFRLQISAWLLDDKILVVKMAIYRKTNSKSVGIEVSTKACSHSP